ncbi:MAG: hypothetical protein ACTSRZ_02270 [Promethearchaeota archaeon]
MKYLWHNEDHDKQVMTEFLKNNLLIRTKIAYPDSLKKIYDEKLEGWEIFEQLVPGLIYNMINLIYEETIGQVSGSNLMQAIKFKPLMAKKYEHLKPIIGEKRFNRYIDFPSKIQKWRAKKLSQEEIRQRLIESLMSLYLTAAKRDPNVINLELLPLARKYVRKFIVNNYAELRKINTITLDKVVRKFLKMLDIGRASNYIKDLVKDIQTYCLIIYFINNYEKIKVIANKKEIVPILQIIRKEISQIFAKLIELEEIQKMIDIAIQKIVFGVKKIRYKF